MTLTTMRAVSSLAWGFPLPSRDISLLVPDIFGQDFVIEQAVCNDRAIVVNDPIRELAARLNF